MISERNDEHVAQAVALLTEQFKGKLNIEGILVAAVTPVQKLEAELWILLWAWTVDYAVGLQLDDLGVVVGEAREGREDENYRTAIRLRVRINRSMGRASDMVEIAAMINELATYVEYFPLAWEVSIYDVETGGDIIRMLTQAKAASSYGVLLTSDWPEEEVFKFDYLDSESVTDATWDYTIDAEVGYKWPAAFPTNPPYRRSTST